MPMNPTAAVNTCAADLRVSSGATADTHAIRERFAQVNAQYSANLGAGMSKSQAITNTSPMIPDGVATNGVDGTRRGEVLKMLSCAGDRAGLDPAMTGELQGMYKDAAAAKSPSMFTKLLGY